MKPFLRYVFTKKYNMFDVVVITAAVSLASSHHWWLAAGVLIGGSLISLFLESIYA